MKGQIHRVIAGYYDISSENKIYRVRASGKLRLGEEIPVVGDFVEFEPEKMINKILDRRNLLIRPKVANVDQAAIVISLKEPDFSSILLNRFLSIIEFQEIHPIIIFTKKDLSNSSYLKEYRSQGYQAFEINNNDDTSLEALKDIFKDKLTVFTGQTGAGKSSTIANLAKVERETQEISKALGRGKHTTRVVEIIDWNKGRLIDTPGFSQLQINMTPLEIANSYHDFKELSTKCKFKNCLHDKEIGCTIKEAVVKNNISKMRYEDYLHLLKETKNE